MLERGSGFPPLLEMARGMGDPSHSVLKQRPLVQGTEALLSKDMEHHAWLSCSACFQHLALISSQAGFYPWDTSSDFPFIQKEGAISEHYRSADNTDYKQQSCEGMPEPGGCLMPDLRRAHVTMPHHSMLVYATGTIQPRGVWPCMKGRTCTLLLSGGQGTQQKMLPVRSAGDIWEIPRWKLLYTHTRAQACCRGRAWPQRFLLWHKMVAPRLPATCTALPGKGNGSAGCPCLTSLRRRRRSSSQLTPAHGNGLSYYENLCDLV